MLVVWFLFACYWSRGVCFSFCYMIVVVFSLFWFSVLSFFVACVAFGFVCFIFHFLSFG